ncbi:hypothetical protein SCYAM73S_05445 [Streptomyces cyaneofuscatus]
MIILLLSLTGATLTIRRFPRSFTLQEMIGFGSLDEQMLILLAGLVQAKFNIIVSGATGTGKTTLLNALSGLIPNTERIVTITCTASRWFAEADAEASRALALGQRAEDPVAARPPTQWEHYRPVREPARGRRGPSDPGHGRVPRRRQQARGGGRLCNLSRVHLATGRTTSAVHLAQQGVAIYEGDATDLGAAAGQREDALGLALIGSEQMPRARDALLEALQIFRESRQQLWHGMTLFRLAELHLAEQDGAQAAAHAEQALAVLRGIGDWCCANVLAVLCGLTAIGQRDRAQVCWSEALAIFEELRSPEAASVRALLNPAGVS